MPKVERGPEPGDATIYTKPPAPPSVIEQRRTAEAKAAADAYAAVVEQLERDTVAGGAVTVQEVLARHATESKREYHLADYAFHLGDLEDLLQGFPVERLFHAGRDGFFGNGSGDQLKRETASYSVGEVMHFLNEFTKLGNPWPTISEEVRVVTLARRRLDEVEREAIGRVNDAVATLRQVKLPWWKSLRRRDRQDLQQFQAEATRRRRSEDERDEAERAARKRQALLGHD